MVLAPTSDSEPREVHGVQAPLVLSVGDPAGIGPEVAVAACLSHPPRGGVVLVGDARRLARRLARPVRALSCDETWSLRDGEIALLDGPGVSDAAVLAHAPTVEGGRAQLRYLDAAAAAVLEGKARALVTGPTSKEAVSLAGTRFVGQTEHLARVAGLAADDVTMMFLGPRLRVALVTTHLAIADLPLAITERRIVRSIRHLADSLACLARANDDAPEEIGDARSTLRIAVTGLNPHAGEGGLFGDEEGRVVAPAVRSAAELASQIPGGAFDVAGPIPAEAAFRMALSGRWEGVVAMLHDQATIASKLVDFGSAVNVTWGLPFVRASVDHGVAYDAARAGKADAASMVAALRMADRLERGRR